jgi:hypothetical protein
MTQYPSSQNSGAHNCTVLVSLKSVNEYHVFHNFRCTEAMKTQRAD